MSTLINIQTIDDIRDWLYTEIAGSPDPEEAWFEIPLNDREIANIVDITLRDVLNWMYDGTQEGLLVVKEIPGQVDYEIPHKILMVPYEYRQDTASGTSLDFTDFVKSPVMYMGGNYVYGGGFEDNLMAYYTQHNITISNIRRLFKAMGQYRFHWYSHTLTFLKPPGTGTDSGSLISGGNRHRIFKCYYSDYLDPDETGTIGGEIFNEPLVRKILLARAKKKIGTTGKYVKPVTLQGYTVDYDALYTEGKEDEDKFMEELMKQGSRTNLYIG